MNYKNIIKSRKMRSRILRILQFIPDKAMLKLQYKIKLGRKLNLKDPKRFTEKIQWYKLNYRNPLMRKCVNKYTVREYVESKGLKDILIPLYAHYKWVEDVDWDLLPDQFVIKTQHGGGGLNVIIVPDKKSISKESVVERLHFSTDTLGKTSGGREWAYGGMSTGIVIEQLLVNDENPEAGIYDYKLFCYKGHVKYIVVDVDRYVGHKRNFYDRKWVKLDITSDCPPSDREVERPQNLDEMIKIAEKLSEDFPYVRVDLYNTNGNVYFGELTFYPWSGYVQFNPDKWDFLFGEDFDLIEY